MSEIIKKCIYRDFNNNGERCHHNITDISNNFCIKHLHIKNHEFYYLINTQIIHNKPIQTIDIISLYTFLYKYNYDFDHIYKIFINIFFNNKNKLYQICTNFGYKLNSSSLKKCSKKKLIISLINKLKWYSTVFFLKSTNNKIIKLQLLWKKYLNNISGLNLGKPYNDFDIFNFEKINNIQLPFQIIDNNIIYCFDTLNLLYHIKTNDEYNPYTMNTINKHDIDRLYHYIYIKDIYIDDDDYKWLSVVNAYTDICLKLDKFGYYTDIRWYFDLDYETIINILNTYHDYVNNYDYLCCEDFDDQYPDYIYKFCEMVLEMLNDTNDASTHAFIFYKSLSENSINFYNGSPDWL